MVHLVCPAALNYCILNHDFQNGALSISIFLQKYATILKNNLLCVKKMSRVMRKPTMWILTRSDTNQAVQPLEVARGLKFCIQEVEVL